MTDLEAQLAATRRDLRDRDATIHRLVNENRQLRAELARDRWPYQAIVPTDWNPAATLPADEAQRLRQSCAAAAAVMGRNPPTAANSLF